MNKEIFKIYHFKSCFILIYYHWIVQQNWTEPLQDTELSTGGRFLEQGKQVQNKVWFCCTQFFFKVSNFNLIEEKENKVSFKHLTSNKIGLVCQCNYFDSQTGSKNLANVKWTREDIFPPITTGLTLCCILLCFHFDHFPIVKLTNFCFNSELKDIHFSWFSNQATTKNIIKDSISIFFQLIFLLHCGECVYFILNVCHRKMIA